MRTKEQASITSTTRDEARSGSRILKFKNKVKFTSSLLNPKTPSEEDHGSEIKFYGACYLPAIGKLKFQMST